MILNRFVRKRLKIGKISSVSLEIKNGAPKNEEQEEKILEGEEVFPILRNQVM